MRAVAAIAGALIAACLVAGAARAETLVLPAAAVAAIAEACPDCAATGLLPCGTPDVAYGRKFQGTAMQGDPPRAYLLASAPVSAELTPLLAGPDAATVADDLARRFQSLKVLTVEADWRRVRLLEPEGAPAVAVDPEQQACFRDPARGLGCCLGDGPSSAGCLPKADPPSAELRFRDGDATLRLRYPVGKGETTLRRPTAAGQVLYWCHKWARAGLRAE